MSVRLFEDVTEGNLSLSGAVEKLNFNARRRGVFGVVVDNEPSAPLGRIARCQSMKLAQVAMKCRLRFRVGDANDFG